MCGRLDWTEPRAPPTALLRPPGEIINRVRGKGSRASEGTRNARDVGTKAVQHVTWTLVARLLAPRLRATAEIGDK